MEVDGAGWPLREYTYLPGVDRPHSVRVSQTGATYYYATDHPGNVIALIDGDNQVVNQYKYGPWGELEMANGLIEQPLGYTAREWDSVAGLYQVRARWYDPHTGRFVSEDPIGLAGGMNVYAYAANSPVNFTDPSGMCPEKPDPNHVVRAAAVEACAILLEAVPSVGGFKPDYGCHGGYTPESLGGSGYLPLGGGQGSSSPSSEPVNEHMCTAAKIGLAGTAALDFLFLSGVGATAFYGAKAWRYGRAAANPLKHTQAVRLTWEAEQAGLAASARAAGLVTIQGEVLSAGWSGTTTLATGSKFTAGLLLDITPVVGTYRAYRAAERACGW